MQETNRIEYKQELTEGLEKEVVAFLNCHEGFSVPRNKEIMRIYKDLKLVEHLGSGVPRILESYPKECFKFSANFLRMSFPSSFPVNELTEKGENESVKKGGAIEGEKGGVIPEKGGAIKKITSRQSIVFQLIKSNKKIGYRAIAEKMGVNESAVQRHVEILKEKGYIERIGGTRGSWKILKNK